MKNQYRVPVKQWRKWSQAAKEVFNRSYAFFINNQKLMLHPKIECTKARFWKTTAWNAAWIAADAADDSIPDKFVSV